MKKLAKFLGALLIGVTVSMSGLVATAGSVAHATDCTLVVNSTDGGWYAKDANGAPTGSVVASTDQKVKDCNENANQLGGKIMTFVKIISTLVVVFAVGMIVYGGFKYVTSQGDPRKAEAAKTQIWYAGVGLFIVLAAYTILQLFVHASGGL